tara:strand:- start:2195 stop:2734 length:540 start_codon:yes stop_codon:yes gene_type:complete
MKLLIAGDSFSADNKGWPSLLPADVTNASQRGVGEYKILKQVEAYDEYDCVLICHTSPWRVHTPYHPIHSISDTRPSNDFLLADVEHHAGSDKRMAVVYEYLKNYYDTDYQMFVWHSVVEKTKNIPNAIHCTFHDPVDTKIIDHNYHHVWQQHPGDINHLDDKGNALIAQLVEQLICNQ